MSKARRWRDRQTGKVCEAVTATKDTVFCQQCKSHKNGPSFCGLKKVHVGRKSTCKEFNRK